MNIVAKISNNLIINSLTKIISYNASKMQASSTSNTKDSAWKRLGYLYISSLIDWKNTVVSKFTQTILLPDNEVLNGNQVLTQ